MELQNTKGYFSVRFLARDGTIKVGEIEHHFLPKEKCLAKKVVSKAAKESMATGEPPLLLVPDSVVKVVHDAKSGSAPLKLSSCQSGPRRKPCGHCDECDRARDEFVTDVLLNAVDFCGDEFSESVKKAVLSVLGSSLVSVPWGSKLDDAEISEIFEGVGEKEAVMSVIGGSTVSIPWRGSMDEEEAMEFFNSMRNGGSDERGTC